MLKAAGQNMGMSVLLNGVNVWKFTIPICFLNHSPGSLRNSWPVDGSVLAGPIQIAVNWRASSYGFVSTALALPPAGFPTTFSKLELIAKTTQLQDASFSVKKAMMLDPQLVYSLPARYITSVDYSRLIAEEGSTTINLASAPSGMLEGIIISIRPRDGFSGLDNWVTPDLAGGTRNVKQGSCTLEKIRLEFGGQNIFRCDSYEEYLHFQRSTFGDSVEWAGVNYLAGTAYAPNGTETSALVHPVYFIPLVNDGCRVFREHTNENLPSYGGSQLQLTIELPASETLKNQDQGSQRAVASPNIDVGGQKGGNVVSGVGLGMQSTINQRGTDYQIWIGYLISGLLEISQGTVDLQL
jgi:hypothetical protein